MKELARKILIKAIFSIKEKEIDGEHVQEGTFRLYMWGIVYVVLIPATITRETIKDLKEHAVYYYRDNDFMETKILR